MVGIASTRRGNKAGVNAAFCPPIEKLAFPVSAPGESDLPEIWPEPLPEVVKALQENKTCDQVYRHLPDIELLSSIPSRHPREVIA